MTLKFSGKFEDLKSKLAALGGDWYESQPNKKVLRLKDGVMNWFESTGSINFQGKGDGKATLEVEVPKCLYPKESMVIAESMDTAVVPEPRLTVILPTKSLSIEQKYLTDGINEGDLIIGIVSAVGTEYKHVTDTLKNRLDGFGYEVKEVRVSSCLPNFSKSGEYERIKHYMHEGNVIRSRSNNNAIMAAGAAKKISEARNTTNPKQAFIVNSLKHPDEVEFLRKIYGDGFYLIGIHADEKRRRNYLTEDKSLTQEQANELIRIDEDENISYGQKTRDTYHLSDFFINLSSNDDYTKNSLQRFLELIFSNPYKNPTFDEFAMFMAFNSSVRSGDLSRQVGAVISREQQILATGANDVPEAGGGLYWAEIDEATGKVEDIADGKDYKRERDSNKQAQIEIIQEITKNLIERNLVCQDNKGELEELLKKSKISDLTEFGRVVHAEMDALLSCGRAGIPTIGSTLYCTTFPCHNCAKHIIASGIKRVVYVEPYPKSRALDFHSESIYLKSDLAESTEKTNELVSFEPFTGVGPRRFLDLFSMSLGSGAKLRRKDKNGKTIDWDKSSAPIRTPLVAKSYLEVEQAAAAMWNDEISAGEAKV